MLRRLLTRVFRTGLPMLVLPVLMLGMLGLSSVPHGRYLVIDTRSGSSFIVNAEELKSCDMDWLVRLQPEKKPACSGHGCCPAADSCASGGGCCLRIPLSSTAMETAHRLAVPAPESGRGVIEKADMAAVSRASEPPIPPPRPGLFA